MDSNESDDDHDMEEHRSTNEDVDPSAALDDFIQQNTVKESALKDSKEGNQTNVSTHVAGDNKTLFSRNIKEEYFVTKEDKPSEEDVSDTSKPPGFENFIKENSECSISSNASRSGKCSTSFGNYKRKELKGFSFIDEMSLMIEVGGTLGYDVKESGSKIDEGLASDEEKSSPISKLQELDYFDKMNSLDLM
nr:RNA-directed DNA polymerase, eukaryota [Tanacetum cinerariifolium]